MDDDCFGMWLEYDEILDVWENVARKIEEATKLIENLQKAKEDIDGSN